MLKVCVLFALLMNIGALNPQQKVRKLLTDLDVISGPAMDVAGALKKVTKISMPYLQAIDPVSALAAAGMKSIFKPTSDEFDAMVFLSVKMAERFSELNKNVEKLRTSISFGENFRDYGDVVSLRLSILEPKLLRIIDPKKNPPIWRDDFVSACKSAYSPLETLYWLNLRLNEYCPMPTKSQATNYALILQVFYEIEASLGIHVAHFGPYYEYKKKMIIFITALPMTKANHWIQKIRAAFLERNTTVENVYDFHELIKESSLRISNAQNSCLLNEVLLINDYSRSALFNTLEIVRRDIARLETIAGMCANVTTDGSAKKIADLFYEIDSLVIAITTKINVWAERKLELSWPEIILTHAMISYPKTLQLSKYEYNKTAHDAVIAANDSGPEDFVHSVLITQNWMDQEWIWAPCPPLYNCTKIMDYHGTNLIVTRHPFMAFQQIVDAHDWFSNVHEDITQIIASNWKTDSLPWLLNEINQKIGGGIRDASLFSNAVFLHNSNLQASKATIDFGISGTWIHLPNLTSFVHVQYFSNSWYPTEPDAENFLLFLFL